MQFSDATGDVGNETAVPCVTRSLEVRVLILSVETRSQTIPEPYDVSRYAIRSYSLTENPYLVRSSTSEEAFNGYKIDFLFNFYHALTVARCISSFSIFSKERKECLIQVKANSTLINFFCICLCYCCRVERVRYLYTTENRFSRRRSVNALI